MEFNSIYSHHDDTPRMHYTHTTLKSEGQKKIEKKSKKKFKKGDDVIPIDSHMTNEEYHTSNYKLKTPFSKLQIQDFKKNFEKKIKKKF